MLIVDLHQVVFSSVSAQKLKIDENLIRHMVLNCLRSYKSKFGMEYGDMVLACDNRKYWRREVFPYYKAGRKKARESMNIDWTMVFDTMAKIKAELAEFFPYKIIDVPGAEADDVIATVVGLRRDKEDILIISGDKDFIQLHGATVRQYDPIKKVYVTHSDPDTFLREHIIKGDVGDGIPNIRSSDDTFIMQSRQLPISQKMMAELTEIPNDHPLYRNYLRNRQLIDLTYIPENVKFAIQSSFINQEGKKAKNLFNYFVAKKLKNLVQSIGDF